MFEDIYRNFHLSITVKATEFPIFLFFSDQIHVFWEGEISWPIKAIINCIGGKRPLQLRPSLSKGVCFPLNNAVCSILKISSLTFFSLSLTLFFFIPTSDH